MAEEGDDPASTSASASAPSQQLQKLQQLQQLQQQQRRRTPAEAARDRWRAAVAARDPGFDSVALVDSLAPDLSDPEWPSKVADWSQWWHGLPTSPRPPQGTRGASSTSSKRNAPPAAAVGAGPYWDERDGAEFFATGRLARRRALLEAAARGGSAADADAVAAEAGVPVVVPAAGGLAPSASAGVTPPADATADLDAAAFGAEAEAEEQVLDLSPFMGPADAAAEDDNEDELEAALLAEGGYGRTEARRLAALSRAFGSAGVEPSAGEAAALARDRRARGTDADAESEAFDDAFARESDAFDALRAAASRRRRAPAAAADANANANAAPLPGNPWGRRLRQELPAALASPDVVRQVGPVRATPGGVRDYWEAAPGGRLLKDPNPRSSLSDLRARAHKRRRRAALDGEWLRLRALRSRGCGLNRDADYFARDARSAAHVREEEEQGGAPRRWLKDEVDALLSGSGAFAPPEVAVPKAAWVLNPLLRADMHGDYCVQHVPSTEQFLFSIGRLFDRGQSAVTPSGGGGGGGNGGGPSGAYARQLHGGPLPNPLVGRRVAVNKQGEEEAFAVSFSAPLNPFREARLRQLGGEIGAAAGGPTGPLARAHARARRRAAEAARAKLERGERLAPDELAALADEQERERGGKLGAAGGGGAAAALGAESPSASPSPAAAAAPKRRGRRPSARD